MKLVVVGALVLAMLCPAAGAEPVRPVARRAFYYWRPSFALTAREAEVLRAEAVQRLYLRFFDLAWDPAGQAIPRGRLQVNAMLPSGVEIVPVVFLTNAVFEHGTDPVVLAKKAWELLRATAEADGIAFSEVQVDCDWTERTREAYFAFCRTLRSLAAPHPAILSATVRLHQIKYAGRTGVPPVDRGMLMFYNVGALGTDPPRMSIFNAPDAERYTASLDAYPLPLDGGLAIFSWAIHGRAGRVVGLIDKPDPVAVAHTAGLEASGPAHYRAVQPALVQGSYLQERDTLTLESMTPARAREAGALLGKHFHPAAPFTVALFDLDERNLAAYALNDLDALYALTP